MLFASNNMNHVYIYIYIRLVKASLQYYLENTSFVILVVV